MPCKIFRQNVMLNGSNKSDIAPLPLWDALKQFKEPGSGLAERHKTLSLEIRYAKCMLNNPTKLELQGLIENGAEA